MFSLYISAMVLMVVPTLEDLEKTKRKKTGERNIRGVERKKIVCLDEPKKLLINGLIGILLWGLGF